MVMDEVVNAVNEETPAGSDNLNPGGEAIEPSAASASVTPPQAVRSPQDNPIPYSRVKEMIAKRDKELEAVRAEASQYKEFLRNSQQGILKAFGLQQEEKPSYIDQKTFEEKYNSLKSEFQQTLEQREMVQQARLGWREVSSKHSGWASWPGFREAVLNQWGSDPSKEMSEVADEIVSSMEKELAKRQAAATQEYGEKKASAPKVVKSGGGAGSPASKDDKMPMKAAIKKMLRGED
jgi:hypothetical protein